MENENIIDSGSLGNSQLSVTPLASTYLDETGRWSKFLAIIGFCFVGLAVVIGLFAGTFLGAMNADLPYPGFVFSLIYIALALLYFFPVYYLFRFSNKIRVALATRSTHELDSAFENLKSHYKYIGIFMIVMLSIYVIILGGTFLFGAMM